MPQQGHFHQQHQSMDTYGAIQGACEWFCDVLFVTAARATRHSYIYQNSILDKKESLFLEFDQGMQRLANSSVSPQQQAQTQHHHPPSLYYGGL
jgi:hypothetical protein